MSCNCYFISVSDFAPDVPMPSDVDTDKLAGPIIDTQETFIRPLLCDDLYDELCTQVAAGTLTAANQTLLDDYIKPVHIRYAFADFLFRHPMTVTKESIVRKISTESELVDMEYINKVIEKYNSYGQTFASKLINFLKDNEDTYPLWDNCRCSEDDEDCYEDNVDTNWTGFF